ncbi:MAG: DUF3168 domain-containing protein [Pseudomonadota bacterium]|nr:DUF3168 domain-containing protein [Pseudomonadota bacterium]
MSGHATLAIRKAAYAALVADSDVGALVGDRIYDAPPEGVTFPYVQLGDSIVTDNDTQTVNGSEEDLVLHTWSRQRGRKETDQVQAAIYGALHRQDLQISGQTLILCNRTFEQVLRDPDGVTYHGVSRYRFLTMEGYTVGAKSYDGTNDFASKPGTNGASSKQFTFVCALNFASPAAGLQYIWAVGSGGNRLSIYKNTSTNTLAIEGFNSIGTRVLFATSTTGISAAIGAWAVLMISVDLATPGSLRVYLGHTALPMAVTTFTDATMATASNWEFGGRSAGSNKIAACVSHLWYANGQYVDLGVEANRRKFIDQFGRPVGLGDTGDLPTGTQPHLFAPNGDPSTNLGSAGNMTITGALTDCASSPTD